MVANHGPADDSVQQPNERQNAINSVASYAHVAVVSRAQVTTQPSNFREAVAAAMYVDQRARERRAKSVVVSGVQPSVIVSSEVTSRQLCTLELGVDPAITFTRRLGVAAGDRDRPLLVGLRSAEDVTAVMMRAKELRQSTTESVCRSVFINRNMTKVEPRMAYEERCRRRRRQQNDGQPATPYRRDDQHQPRTTGEPCSGSSRSAAATSLPSGESSTVGTTSQSTDVSMSPGAPEFIPVCSSCCCREASLSRRLPSVIAVIVQASGL